MAIPLEHARGLWLQAQRLSSPAESAADAVRASGWWHAAGGSTVALSMVARGISLADAVAAELDREELVEVPGVRRSMFLVPREEAGLALAASARSTRELIAGAWRAAGCSAKEIAAMKRAILDELETYPLSAGTLGKRMPVRSVRKTGSNGGALALPSTVHLALRELQHEGRVVRIPEERRLDGDRYVWKPAAIVTVALTDEALDQALVKRFVGWAGPAALKEIAWWVGITQKASRGALEALRCATVEVEAWCKQAFVDEARLDDAPTQNDEVMLLPFRDSYLALRRGLAPVLSARGQQARLLDWRGKPAVAGSLDALHHPSIVHRGLIVGIWEYDPEEKIVVWRVFDGDATLKRAVTQAIAGIERLIREELGDARFYPFDSGQARRARIDDAMSSPGLVDSTQIGGIGPSADAIGKPKWRSP